MINIWYPRKSGFTSINTTFFLRILRKYSTNFKIIDLQRKDYHEQDGSITIDLVIVAGK